MKQITPFTIWYSGSTETATQINTYCINDNLTTQAQFYWALYDVNNIILQSGNLTMTGADYTAYETNQYAYDWIAKQLNITYVTV